MSLKDKTIKGVKWTTFGSLFNSVLQIVQLVILARILSPSDFGLMAIVMVIIGFSNMFIDMGISNAIIYKQKVTENKLTSLYWLNVFVGFALFLIILVVSPFIAEFYKTPQLTKLIILVGTTFLIQPFGQQFMILLQKELQFDTITKTQMISRFCSFIAIILFAIFGYGVLSLAYGIIFYSLLSTLIFIYYGVKIYKPRFYFRKNDLDEFLNFGLYQLAQKVMDYFRSEIDTILIGKFLSIEILGVYNIAKSLVSKPSSIINPVITKVTFPVMSKINHDNKKLKEVYLKTINLLIFINTPIYLLIFLFAKPIVILLIGSVWIESVPIIQILAIVFLVKSIGNPAGSLLLSRGKANIAFYWNIIPFLLNPVFIYYGNYYGVKGVAISLLFLPVLLLYPNWRFIVYRFSYVNLKEYVGSIFPYLLIGTFCLILGNYTLNRFESTNYFIFLFGVFAYSVFYLTLVYLFKRVVVFDILALLNTKSSKNHSS